jgi:broad specificity polyphosphatase/5'/3'-nucleotidase SurE
VLSVNFPAEAGVATPRVVTRIAHVAYDQLFQRRGEGHYVHDFGGAFRRRAGLDGTDLGAARDGKVSITPVRLAHTAEISAGDRAALERG